MKILVTGGAGYIGSCLVPLLLEQGHTVTIFDNFSWGIRPILHFAAHPGLKIISGDVRNSALLGAAVDRAEFVVHLAAIVGYPACTARPEDAVSVNAAATKELMRRAGNKPVVYASTGSTYGKVEGVCDEDSSANPLSIYGTTKWDGEQAVLGGGGVSLRLATVFGVASRLRLDLLVNDFVFQAVHNKQIILYEGHFRRSFLHVRDTARAFVFAVENYDKMAGEPFNVGQESMNYTKREVAEAIRKRIDFYLHEADIGEDPDKRDYAVSYEKLKRLGYSATVTLDDGIKELLKVLAHLKLTDEWRNV